MEFQLDEVKKDLEICFEEGKNVDEKHDGTTSVKRRVSQETLMTYCSVFEEEDNQIQLNSICPSMPKSDNHIGNKGSVTSGKRRVTFDTLEIRNYYIILGDHPECPCGPPLSLGWHFSQGEIIPLEQYESTHSDRRTLNQLRIPSQKRNHILTCFSGHTDIEIQEVITEINRVKKQRKISQKELRYRTVQQMAKFMGKSLFLRKE
mmetsp:Transcript_6524/g.9482  ORF Transcript_6524/g.9482 Transcript_6524/m.9482 type:complete len:205 (+) Transcript_6524:106-720(+)|eukprot:CAMPEP_0195513364 /NCGR_PEP_ID=MMETSP0794_2-20130614/5032_1 /TAXON_ID=515487 /ORGANISM="Stephanopyxis turris, Strain CCMP 815" /LENGTH=204 /DNA_ID=CAMNT_0040641355 /DNA_START=106 /DNA_END=720 /DNA_ORIENTATION=-